jgi:uncharacterized protein involved in type VI secretion and phage assembly
MSSLVQAIRMMVRRELAAVRQPALGTITAVNPHASDDDEHNDEVDVALQYEDLTLPRVPVAVRQPGTVAPLKVGDLVLVEFLNGDLQQPLVAGTFHHDDERPPVHDKGELVIEHRSPDGSINQLRFGADGAIALRRDVVDDDASVTLTLTQDGKLKISIPDGEMQITCTRLTITGDTVFKDGAVSVEKGDVTVKQGMLTASNGQAKTTIDGNRVTGATGGA